MNRLLKSVSNLSSDSWLSIFIFSVAFIFSVLVADSRYHLGPDGILAINTAMNFVDGKGFATSKTSEEDPTHLHTDITKPPLYSLFIAGLMSLDFSGKLAAWIISQFSLALSAVLLFRLARLGMPKTPAIMVGGLFSVLISNHIWGIAAKEDTLYMTLTFAVLLLFSKLRTNAETNYVAWLGLGILASFAILTRYLGISLIVTVFFILAIDCFIKQSPKNRLWLFSAGLLLTGLIPLINFISTWSSGRRPSFFEAPDTTWYLTVSGIIHSFQTDFLGTNFAWLYDGSISDLIIFFFFVCFLFAVAYQFIRQRPDLSSIGIYVISYLITLSFQLARKGFNPYEFRFSFPIEGLIILITVYLIWSAFIKSKIRSIQITIAVFSIFFIGTYLNGQWMRFSGLNRLSGTPKPSREYCPSPETIAWIKSNIQPGEIIFGNQCSYQLLAETNRYFWLTIPPADEYTSSKRFQTKWNEDDFIRIKQKTGAQWIVLLMGQSGDPMLRAPGYGELVTKLHEGQDTSAIKLQAQFSDGLVFRIL